MYIDDEVNHILPASVVPDGLKDCVANCTILCDIVNTGCCVVKFFIINKKIIIVIFGKPFSNDSLASYNRCREYEINRGCVTMNRGGYYNNYFLFQIKSVSLYCNLLITH